MPKRTEGSGTIAGTVNLCSRIEEDWGDSVFYSTPGMYVSGGRRTVEVRDMVPQMRSHDGGRLLYPKSAYIIHKEAGYLPDGPADCLHLEYCRQDFGGEASASAMVGEGLGETTRANLPA